MLIYFLLVRIAALFNHKARLLVKGQRTLWQQLKEQNAEARKGKWLWIHAASVGEFEQAKPIIKAVRADNEQRKANNLTLRFPEYIIVTFFSSSGYEACKTYRDADLVSYLPFATKRNARRFIDMINPRIALFIKYEFWGAYLKELKKRDIPLYSVCSTFRPNQFFFKPIIGRPYLNLLRCFTRLLVQDDNSLQLLDQHGIDDVVVVGDTRFDRVANISENYRLGGHIELLLSEFTDGKTIVAGSTWQPDEKLLAKYIEEHSDVRLILVPHEIHEEHLRQIFNIFKGRYVRFSEADERNIRMTRVLLIDTIGMLSKLYHYSTITYVGGGFGVGIHNTLEPAAHGKAVVFGPNYKNFREAAAMIACGAAISINNYQQLASALDNAFLNAELMGNKAAEYVQSEQGATAKIIDLLCQ